MAREWAGWPGRGLAAGALLAMAYCACAQQAALPKPATGAAQMRATYQRLGRELADNDFRRPLVLASSEEPGTLAGDIHAVIGHPFASVKAALANAADWCDVLILHVNTKFCRAEGTRLAVQMGTKAPEALDAGAQVPFTLRVLPASADYFQAELGAERGPLATRNYRIQLEAVALPGNQTFVRLAYSLESGLPGRIAMAAYLATAGRGEVGFTRVGQAADGRPVYIDGVRALVERNTMRYYLAMEAFLDALDAPAAERFERRIEHWFSAAETYTRQLQDMERPAYLAMKRDEYRRQQAAR